MSNNQIHKSMGWSLFTEVAVKFIVPITNMLLARLLAPEAFGMIAVCNMIITFFDLITEAGFSKYLIQRDFSGDSEKRAYANVAFWSNFIVSILVVSGIWLFRDAIALALGSLEYSIVVAVASLQILITSISSIQLALLRRSFSFKALFNVRILGTIVPLLVTVPLAMYLRSYWALIIGNLAVVGITAIALTYVSDWRPTWFFKVSLLQEMLSYSIWSLLESVAHWFIFWVDIFIISNIFTMYQIGLYKNSANMVQSIMGMITASMSPVLLSALSRLKGNQEEYLDTFYMMQKLMLYVILPLGVGVYLFSDSITLILFGDKWLEAGAIVGAWGLMMMVSTIFYSFPAELYKSKGIPQILFLIQVLYLVVLIPVCIMAADIGFWELVYYRCYSIVWLVCVGLLFMKRWFSISFKQYSLIFVKPLLATLIMVGTAWGLKVSGVFVDMVSMVVCMVVYALGIGIFFRGDILRGVALLKGKRV